MLPRLFSLSALLAIVFATGSIVMAQGRSGGSSAFGSSGFGSSGFGSSGFGSSGFGGGGGMGSSGFGSSGFGGGGMGSSGFGNSGFGNSMGQGGFGNSSFGNSGFGNAGYGGNQNGGQNFIGRSASDMQGTFGQMSQMNRAGTQFFNNMNRQMGRDNNRKTTKTTSNPPQPLRMEVHVAFDAPHTGSDVVANTLRTRLAKILADHHMTLPVVTVQGDTAVLSGAVASDGERQVIAQLVSLEPGVRAVRNEMTVAGASSETIVPPAGS